MSRTFHISTCLQQWLRVNLFLGASGVGILVLYHAIRLAKAWKQAIISELVDLGADPFNINQVEIWEKYTVGPWLQLNNRNDTVDTVGAAASADAPSLMAWGRAVESSWLTEMAVLARGIHSNAALLCARPSLIV
eukprot:COSAG02_NODE_26026_length_643_cov_0.569853_2_plen_134_part_01